MWITLFSMPAVFIPRQRSFVLDADGFFSVDELEPGRYQLQYSIIRPEARWTFDPFPTRRRNLPPEFARLNRFMCRLKNRKDLVFLSKKTTGTIVQEKPSQRRGYLATSVRRKMGNFSGGEGLRRDPFVRHFWDQPGRRLGRSQSGRRPNI